MPGKLMQFKLDQSSGVPFYRQVIQQIEQAILTQRLFPGDRLPTIRALAIELKINPNTIAKAYNELEIKGILLTQVGSGTYVSEKKPNLDELGRKKKIDETLARFVSAMQGLGVARGELLDLIRYFKEEA